MSSSKKSSETDWDAPNVKMFLEKLTFLNRAFLKVINAHVDATPDVDLSPTVRDYLKHVESLDQMYGEMERAPAASPVKVNSEPVKEDTSVPKPISLVAKKNETIVVAEKRTTISFDGPPTKCDDRTDDEGRRGRKRAKRGGGPDGGNDHEIIIEQNKQPASITFPKLDETSKLKTTVSSFTFGKPTEAEGSDSAKMPPPIFSLEKKDDSSVSSANGSSNPFNAVPPIFSFGKQNDIHDEGTSKKQSTATFTFGKKNDVQSDGISLKQPASTFTFFGKQREEQDESASKQPPSTVFSFGKQDEVKAESVSKQLPTPIFPFGRHNDVNEADPCKKASPRTSVLDRKDEDQTAGASKQQQLSTFSFGERNDVRGEGTSKPVPTFSFGGVDANTTEKPAATSKFSFGKLNGGQSESVQNKDLFTFSKFNGDKRKENVEKDKEDVIDSGVTKGEKRNEDKVKESTDQNTSESKKTGDDKKIPSFSFKPSDAGSKTFSFGKALQGNGTKPSGPLFTFTKNTNSESTTNDTSTKDVPKIPPLLSLAKDGKPSFTFGGFSKPSADSIAGSADTHATTNPVEGFKFGSPPVAVATSSTSKADGEAEGEYVPPKAEAVIREEPNAVFISKCSVFVLKKKEYEKLGVGQVHIKDAASGSKKILLIRAATTIGAVWVNAFIDDTLKVEKVEETKVRITCVSDGVPSVFLVRLPDAKGREVLEKELSP